MIVRLTRKAPHLSRQNTDPLDTRRLLADISKAKSLLGGEPLVDLENGLNIFIAWLRELPGSMKNERRPT